MYRPEIHDAQGRAEFGSMNVYLVPLCQIPGSSAGSGFPGAKPAAEASMRHFVVLIVLILHDLAAPSRDIILKLSHSKARLRGMIPQARHRAQWPMQHKDNGM